MLMICWSKLKEGILLSGSLWHCDCDCVSREMYTTFQSVRSTVNVTIVNCTTLMPYKSIVSLKTILRDYCKMLAKHIRWWDDHITSWNDITERMIDYHLGWCCLHTEESYYLLWCTLFGSIVLQQTPPSCIHLLQHVAITSHTSQLKMTSKLFQSEFGWGLDIWKKLNGEFGWGLDIWKKLNGPNLLV